MNLRPLGDRVLIRPLKNPEQTESGLVLVEHRKPETMGTVVSVGTGTRCTCCEVAREASTKAGDTVIFSWTAGREVEIDDTGDRYLMMREDDILAVIEGLA